jgi:sugar phosphate isomerase/epimerase
MASKLAVQMYTLRDFTKTAKDLETTLEKVHAIGYTAVQLSAVGAMEGEKPQVTAQQARALLDANRLQCIATHRSWDALAKRADAEIAFHKTLGCNFVAIGSLPASYQNDGKDGYRRFLADAAPVIAKLKAAGIRFGYHNHAHEFQRVGPGRRTLYDIFIEEGGPDFHLEVDVYWAVHAGINPVRLFERCPNRTAVIHAKDKEVVPKEGPVMAACGEGNLDWESILPACKQAGVEWYAVEQDVCRRDPFDCLRASYQFLSGFAL